MPTGYTAELMEKGESFKSFVMRCVRGMGVCSEMRDMDMDTPIPEEFVPSSYYTDVLAEARQRMEQLRKYTDQEKLNLGIARQAERKVRNKEMYQKAKEENSRLAAMAAMVKAWKPGDQYISFKDFMLQQLDISKNHLEYYERAGKKQTEEPLFYYIDELESTARNIEYYTKELESEKRRYAENNIYLKGIRESLKKLK